ncbi:C-type lectin lectoxin-Thr1-like [Candoia aspera]|uniref:C-type lectin lectoxin-Thr1-like n=1 Tax=Candoia aspera TaxID=51853 RepID=UPI002FD81DB4
MGRFALVSLGWLILAVSLSGAGAQLCCPFTWYTYRGVCYKVFDKKFRTWKDAEAFCTNKSPGCHLASIHSETESAAIADYFHKVEIYGNIWIGLWDPLRHRTWQWSDGSKTDFSSWDEGEPNNYGGNEYCVELRERKGYRKWNDRNCDHGSPFLCKCPLKFQHKNEETLETKIAAPDSTPAPQ